ncbi:MAG: efflux RND transporter periplasmic adaptor subunit [candidate division KSB1 bacterium]|nr:efflux RND transporter periplasmic adaptor subunit [candidate division KSB1 bacterium]
MKTNAIQTWTGKLFPWALLFLIVAGLSMGMIACGDDKAKTEQSSESGQLWTCGMHPQVIQNEPGNCPICGMKLTPLRTEQQASEQAAAGQVAEHKTNGGAEHEMAEMDMGTADAPAGSEKAAKKSKKGKKILYWRAPMDPTYISDKPGKSPMGMDLIPVYEGEENLSTGSKIIIDPIVVQNIGVKTTRVEVKRLRREIRTVGHVDYNEEKLYRVNTKFSGWIEKLYVNETGQEVVKGMPMLEIYSPELVSTQEEYLLAYQNVQKLKDNAIPDIYRSALDLLAAARRRLRLWDITEAQIRELEEKGKVVKTMTIYSPQTGIVLHKNAEEGMYVKPGMDLFRIADLSSVWVYAHLFEYEVPWVAEGDEVEMESPYIPGVIFRGRVDYIYPYLDTKTRDVKVRIEVPNRGLRLKPQMYTNVHFLHELERETPVVPSEAVIRTGRRNLVFIALGNGQFEPREIILGAEGENGEYQVLAGLKGGEEIVTSAQFLLDSESRIQEAIQKMIRERLKKK